jgi:polyhydroxybutyrate depolymerase
MSRLLTFAPRAHILLLAATALCCAGLVLFAGCAADQATSTSATAPPPTGSTTAAAGGTTTTESVPAAGDYAQKLESGGLTRTFLVHIPSSYDGSADAPLVIALHGHGGTGAGQARLTHMSDVADANGFIVVYPDGVNHAWNDGRSGINGADEGIDDTGFIRDLIKRAEAEYKIDPSRVYATGFSNGGFMCYRLARDLPDLIAAVAPVSGLLSEELEAKYTSATPISVLIIAGTADPLIPFEGGEAAAGVMAGRGMVFSAAETASFFVKLDGCSTAGETVPIPNAVLQDGAKAGLTTYSGGHQDTEVELYTVFGGGHTWPGGLQYSPVRVAGPTCRDFDASQLIWQFFARHQRQL